MFDSGFSSSATSSSHLCHQSSSSGGTTAMENNSFQHTHQPSGGVAGTNLMDPSPGSPVSTTSAFLLGIHNYKALDDVDLPEFVKEHQATLTFPEKLMLMLTYVDKEYKTKGNEACEGISISWILDGRAFIIRSKEEFVKHLLPMFFRQAKFPSFTRKLYRWGFRQVSVAQERSGTSRREMIFGHEFFQRDNKSLMARMRSVTAAGTRRAVAAMSLKDQQQVAALGNEKLAIEPKNPQGIVGKPLAVQPCAAPAPTYPPLKVALGVASQQDGAQSTHPTPHTSDMPTLSNALALSHQQKALFFSQHTSPETTTNLMGKEPSTSSEGAPTNTAPPTMPYPQFPQLSTFALPPTPANIAAAQERIRNRQDGMPPESAPGGDPNAYMRAAVDMLLRYAS